MANKDRISILPSQEELHRLLSYNPETGELLWRSRPRSDFQTNKSHAVWNARYAGTPALNSPHPKGYRHGTLLWMPVKAHRVIWKYMTGEDAEVVDHDDGDRSNNAWGNLNNGSDGDNMKNKKKYDSNKSGVTGVYWNKDSQKWHAQIRSNGPRIHLGFFDSLEDAKRARAEAEARLGFNRNHGRLASQPQEAKIAFRTTPNLGPDLDQFDTSYAGWMQPSIEITPELGNPELGSDGHYYVLVKAGAALNTAGTAITINETTWVATAGAGGYVTPVASIPNGAYFYARSKALPGGATAN